MSSQIELKHVQLCFGLIPVSLSSTLFFGLLVPYLTQVWKATNFHIIGLFAAAAFFTLFIGFSRLLFKNPDLGLESPIGLAVTCFLWLASFMGVVVLSMWKTSLVIDRGYTKIGVILCYVVHQIASSFYYDFLQTIFEKKYWSPLVKFFALMIGASLGAGLPWIFSDPLQQIVFIFSIAGGVALLCLIFGVAVPYCQRDSSKRKETVDNKELLSMYSPIKWIMAVFTFVLAMAIGSFMFFVTNWYASGVFSAEKLVSKAGQYDMGVAMKVFSIFVGVRIFMCSTPDLILDVLRRRFCSKGSTARSVFFGHWIWTMITLAGSTIILFSVINFSDILWISAPFVLGGVETVMRFGPISLFKILMIGRDPIQQSIIEIFLVKCSTILCSMELAGQATGALISMIIIKFCGDPHTLKFTGACGGLAVLILISILFIKRCLPKSTSSKSTPDDDSDDLFGKPVFIRKILKRV